MEETAMARMWRLKMYPPFTEFDMSNGQERNNTGKDNTERYRSLPAFIIDSLLNTVIEI